MHIGTWKLRLEQLVRSGRILSQASNHPELPSLLEASVDESSRVFLRDREFTWQPGAKKDLDRLPTIMALSPERAYLVQCLDEAARYVAFIFDKVIVLACPVRQHSTYWLPSEGVRVEDLPLLLATKAEARRNGAKCLHTIGDWRARMRDIVLYGEPRTYGDWKRKQRRTHSREHVTA
jgi:hypothetical protein